MLGNDLQVGLAVGSRELLVRTWPNFGGPPKTTHPLIVERPSAKIKFSIAKRTATIPSSGGVCKMEVL